jgi:hypothetical protein
VALRNFNNNLDDARDPGLALTVHVTVTGLPGGTPFEADRTLEEGGAQELLVPFSGDAGEYPVTVNATSGELRLQLQGTVVVAFPRSGLPGFEPLLVLAAVPLALLAQRRARP